MKRTAGRPFIKKVFNNLHTFAALELMWSGVMVPLAGIETPMTILCRY